MLTSRQFYSYPQCACLVVKLREGQRGIRNMSNLAKMRMFIFSPAIGWRISDAEHCEEESILQQGREIEWLAPYRKVVVSGASGGSKYLVRICLTACLISPNSKNSDTDDKEYFRGPRLPQSEGKRLAQSTPAFSFWIQSRAGPARVLI